MSHSPEYEVLFYQTADGRSFAKEFLGTLEIHVKAKFEKWLEQLELQGPNLPRPFADVVYGKVRELRLRFGPLHYRFLYFFAGKKIIITHGFIKKTDRVPEEEIVRAIRYMNDFLARFEIEGDQ